MGVLPSRSFLERPSDSVKFVRSGNYDVAHIPLTAHFFPSPDCLAFRQLFECRLKQSIKYNWSIPKCRRETVVMDDEGNTTTTPTITATASSSSSCAVAGASSVNVAPSSSSWRVLEKEKAPHRGGTSGDEDGEADPAIPDRGCVHVRAMTHPDGDCVGNTLISFEQMERHLHCSPARCDANTNSTKAATTTTTTRTSAQGKEDAQKVADAHHHRFLGSRQRLYRYLVGNNEAFLVGTNDEMQHIHHEELRWRRARAVVVEWRRRMAKLATEEERTYGLAHPPVEVMEAEEVPPPRMFLRCAPQATIVALNCQEDDEGEEMRSSEGEEVADTPGTSSQQQQQVVVGGATRKRSSMERVRHRIASEPSLRDGRLHVVEEDGQLYIFALEPNSNNSQGGGGDASPMVMMMMSSSTSTAASAARGSEGSRPSVERKQHQAALQRHVMTSPVGVGGHPPPPSEANASDAGSFPQSRLTTAVFGVDTTPRSARGAFSSSSSANNDDGASAHDDDDDDVAGGVCVDVATLVFAFPITAFQVVGYSGAVEGPCRGTPWLRGLQDDPIEDHYIEVEMQQRFPGHPRPPVLRASYFIDATIGEKILSRASFVSDRRFHATCLRCGLSDGIVRPMWAYCSMVSVPEIQLGREYDQRLHMTIFRFLQLQRTMRERRPDKRWPLGDLIEADLRRIRQLGTDATTTITATTTTTASSSSCASALESCTPWEDLPAMSLEFSKHMAVTTVRGSRSLWRCREEVQSLFMKLFSLDEADPAELGLLDYYYPATATTPPSYTPSCEEITAQCTSSCTFESEDGGLRASQMDYGGTVVLEDYSCTPPPHDDDDGDGGWKPHQRLGPPRNLELLLQYHNNYVQYLHAPPGDDLEVVLPSSSSRLNPMELEEDGEPMERALIGAVFVVVDASSSARGPTLAHLHDIANLVAKAEKEAAEHPDDGVVVCGCEEEDPLHGQHQWSYPAMTFIDGDSVSYDVVYRRWEHLAVFLSRRRVQLQRIRATQTSSKEEHKSVVVVGTATTLDGKQQQQQQLEQLGVCQPCCVPLEGFLGRLSRCGYLECVVVSWIKRRIRHAQSMHRLHESWLRDARQDYKITQEGRYYISCSTHDGEVFYHGVIPRFAKKEKRRKEKRQMQKMLRNTDEESGTNNNNNNSNSGRGRSGRRARHRSVSRSLSETSCSTRQPRANSREKGSRRNSNTSQQGGGGGVSPTKSLRRGGRPSSVLRLDHRQPANASNSANNGVGGSSGCSSRTKTCRKALALSPPRPTTSRSRSQRHRHTTTTSPSATAGGRTSARHPSRQRDGRAPLPSPSSLCCRCGGPANNNNNNNTSAAFYPGSVSVPVSSADAVVGVEQSGSSPSFPSSMASSPHQPPSNTFFGHTQTSPLYPASHNNNNNSNNSYSGWQGCVPHTAQQPCYTGMDYHGSTTQAMAAPHNARGCCMPTNHNKYPAACASGGGGGGGRRITVDVGNTFHPHLQHPPPSPHQHHYHQHPCQMPHHHRGSGGHSMSVPPPRGAHMRHEDAPPARVSCCSPKRAISPGRYVWDPYQK